MRILKGFALSLLGFLLFLSLVIFGVAFTLNSTALNHDFYVREMDRVDVSALAEEPIGDWTADEGYSEEFRASLLNTVSEVEPLVKKQVADAISPILDYLEGRSERLDLAQVLSDTLSPDFIASVLDRVDIATPVKELVAGQIAEEVPLEKDYLTRLAGDVITDVEPWLKEQVVDAAGPVVDYLLGKSRSLDVVITLSPLVDSLRAVFMRSPPAELAGDTQPQLEQYFNDNFGDVIPATVELNEESLGDVTTEIDQALSDAEDGLAQARQAVGYFRLGYWLLIGFILLLVLVIALICREVRGATRALGIVFLVSGAILFAGNLVAKSLVGAQITRADIPAQFHLSLPKMMADFLAPLVMYSIILGLVGVALLVTSLVYRRRQT